MNRKLRKNNKLHVVLLCGAIAILLLLVAVIIKVPLQEPTSEEIFSTEAESEETISSEETTEYPSTEETEEETTTEEETIVYPEPEYDFTTEEVTIELDNLEKEYKIAWVSDVHLISDHEAGDVQEEYLETLKERYEILPIDADGTHAEELWPEIIKYLNYKDFDAVIFGGDIMDYCSSSNIAIVKEGLDSLRIPYMYIRADHDYGAYYGGEIFTEANAIELHQTIDGDSISQKFWDFGDFIVLGIDRSTKDMPDYYLNMVKDVYSRGKPVIMATHAPYGSGVDSSLEELSMQVRNKIYYWGGGDYTPNNVTSEYLDLIYSEDTIVKQVLAGHLHASWDGMISEQVSQHIFTPAFRGNIGVIHVVPAE